jgi:hypothetical protein
MLEATHTPAIERTGFRLSWGAIFAGVVVATALQIVLTILGVAIGFGAFDEGDAMRQFGVGAGVWMLVAALLSLFVGGLVTGRMAGVLTRGDGAFHGIVLWGLTAIAAVWMVSSGAGTLLGGAFSVVGQTAASTAGGLASATGQVATTAISQGGDIDVNQLQREVGEILRASEVPALHPDSISAMAASAEDRTTSAQVNNEQLASQIAEDIRRRAGQVDRDAVVNVIAARTELTESEADRIISRLQSAASNARSEIAMRMDTLQESAGDVALAATDKVSTAAWWALLAMALGATAAGAGAAMTARS